MKGIPSMLGGIALGVAAFLLMAGQALAGGGDGHEEHVDGYKVVLSVGEGTARKGHNDARIELQDSQGRGVSGARVVLQVMKHDGVNDANAGGGGHEGMAGHTDRTPPAPSIHDAPETKVELHPGHHAGEYVGELDFDDAGDWMVEAAFEVEGIERSVAFTVEVPNDGQKVFVIWGFLGTMAAVVVTAGIVKRGIARVPASRATA